MNASIISVKFSKFNNLVSVIHLSICKQKNPFLTIFYIKLNTFLEWL